jgi:hypothetical protein
MGFGESFPILLAFALTYGIPLAVLTWVVVTFSRMRRQLDQIQARLDALSAEMDARR